MTDGDRYDQGCRDTRAVLVPEIERLRVALQGVRQNTKAIDVLPISLVDTIENLVGNEQKMPRDGFEPQCPLCNGFGGNHVRGCPNEQ